MLLSISLDITAEEAATGAIAGYRARAERIEAAAADIVLLAREEEGDAILPPRIEALVHMPWLTGILRTPAVIAGIPALHGFPFHVARALSAIDFLSNGRAGWMPLTGGRDRLDPAYGAAYPLPAEYVIAKYDDFIRATQALWDSWDADALILDKASGVYLDSAKVRRVDYRGPFHATMGPLNAARPPQGHPLLMRDLAEVADAATAADLVLGDRAMLASAPTGSIRLLRLDAADAAARDEAVAAVAAGLAEGLHLTGTDAVAQLEALRAHHPRTGPTDGTARARLGLDVPANPFSQKVLADV